ncbi:MAG TPA: recombinase family protein [Oscillospiraceae bacterium]|nr:recombinase family protein [Oscillospiraceae bacterium]
MKVAIYCRLSEEDRNKQNEYDDSESIQNQKSLLIKYAFDHSWEIYNIYSDDDYTGSDRNRPQFCKLLDEAKEHKFDIVLCKTQSRFTRELELVEKYIHGLFPLWNIRFISVVDNADTDVKGNKKARQINGLINEWYLEDMSDNIKSVLTNKRQNGYHIGSFALYGYMKDPERKGHLIIDEEAADIVREVFLLYSQGIGKTSIAQILNERGIPNPTEHKRLKGLRYSQPKSKNATLWKYFAISHMLQNEIYIGNMVQGKYGSISYKSKQNKPNPKEKWIRTENTHEPIVGRELWDKVQSMIKLKAKPFSTGNIGIFARKVRCSVCGYIMRSCKNRGRHYLQCSTKYASKGTCIGAFVPVGELEQAVLSELKKLKCEYFDNIRIENGIEHSDNISLSQKIKRLKTDIKIHQSKLSEYSECFRSTYIDKVRGIITEAEFMDFSGYFNDKKQAHENALKILEEELESVEYSAQKELNKKSIIELYANIEHLDRDIIEKLIDVIYVGKKNSETKELPIEIHWNF